MELLKNTTLLGAPVEYIAKAPQVIPLCTWGWDPLPSVILLGQGVLRLAVHHKCGDAG